LDTEQGAGETGEPSSSVSDDSAERPSHRLGPDAPTEHPAAAASAPIAHALTADAWLGVRVGRHEPRHRGFETTLSAQLSRKIIQLM